MKKFNITQRELFRQYLDHKENNEIKCSVLFPDGTIFHSGCITLVGSGLLLCITMHGVEFQEWVGIGMSRFKNLKYHIVTNEKTSQ